MSILSERPDGAGYHYGFAHPDHRQINVRRGPVDLLWRAYVGGNRVGSVSDADGGAWETKTQAEAAAIAWMKAHPVASAP